MESTTNINLTSGKELEKFLRFETDNDIYFLFKYSPLCMTSFMIEKSFDSWFENQDSQKFSLAKINVVSDREISQKAAQLLKVTHQSPQLIVFNSEGELIWHGSHGEINEKKLDEIIKTRLQDTV